MDPTKDICLILESDNFSSVAFSALSKRFDVRKGFYNISQEDFYKVSVVLVRLKYQIDQDFIKDFINLKFLLSPTTGTNHINLPSNNKIKIISLKGEETFLNTITATAEFSWAIMLSAWRKLFWANLDVKKGNWDRDSFKSSQLSGKKVGIIGLGRVGSQIAQFAYAFDMHVSYFDTLEKVGVRPIFTDIIDIFEHSDIVFLCASHNDGNSNFINKKYLSKLKENAVFVNTARGELIDENDLIDTLKGKQNTIFALDVLCDEVSLQHGPGVSEIWNYYNTDQKNLILTPHLAGACNDAMHKTEEFCVAKLFASLENNKCRQT